jgi:hypothetical protein
MKYVAASFTLIASALISSTQSGTYPYEESTVHLNIPTTSCIVLIMGNARNNRCKPVIARPCVTKPKYTCVINSKLQNTANVRYITGSGMYPIPRCSPPGFRNLYSIENEDAPSPHIRIAHDTLIVAVMSTFRFVRVVWSISNE